VKLKFNAHTYTHGHLPPHILLVAMEVKVKQAGEGRTAADGGSGGGDQVAYAAANGGNDGTCNDDDHEGTEVISSLWVSIL